ncbi:hypothetical protein B0H19DRAFT_1079316 [Mycena capillaripes]|nr:hypothetical protein B0H19DRAFT_1079316 [Mycena capillaripes]
MDSDLFLTSASTLIIQLQIHPVTRAAWSTTPRGTLGFTTGPTEPIVLKRLELFSIFGGRRRREFGGRIKRNEIKIINNPANTSETGEEDGEKEEKMENQDDPTLFKLRSIPANAVQPGSSPSVIVMVPDAASHRAINIRHGRHYVTRSTNFDKHCIGANIDRWLPPRTETKAAAANIGSVST